MNIVLIYTIKEAESGRSIAAFLLDSGYSSRLVVHLRNTEGSFLLNGKTVFSNTVLQSLQVISEGFSFLRHLSALLLYWVDPQSEFPLRVIALKKCFRITAEKLFHLLH